jgi:hypothetical protein
MNAHVAAGRPATALAAYARLRTRLSEDLGVSPGSETIALHRRIVTAEDAEPTGAGDRERAGTDTGTRLVGRTDELARLDDALAAAQAGTVTVVEVVGEAGIGKTALVAAWVSRALARGCTVLSGRCDELGRDLPLQPVLDAVAAWLAQLAPEEAAAAVAVDAPLLGPLFGAGRNEAAAATIVTDAGIGRLRLYASLLALVLRAGGDGGTAVLVLEDTHHPAAGVEAWTRFAMQRLGHLLIVTTSLRRNPGVNAPRCVELGPLDRAATRELVGAERADELFAHTGGHPLFLLALVAGDPGAVPADVETAVRRWAGTIGDAATATLRGAAALGERLDLDLLADVVGRPAVEVLGDLETAAAAGLLVERGDGFAFRHALVRRVLDHDLGSSRRALLNRTAAEALHRRPGSDPLAVAIHARLGGNVGLAAESLVSAAAAAAGRHELDAAERLLDEAVALTPTATTLIARARVRMARFQLAGAAEDADAAIDAGGGAEALEVGAWIAYYRRRYEEAGTYADAGLARSAEAGIRASCLTVAGRARHGRGDLGGGAERLAAAADSDAPPAVRGVADVWLAFALLHQGRPAVALARVQRALLDAEHLAHPFAPLHGHFARVMALGHLAQPAAALRGCDDFDSAIARSGEIGRRLEGPAANMRGWVLRWTGNGAQAAELNEGAAEATYGGAPMHEAQLVAWLDLADGSLLAGDLDTAAAIVTRLDGHDLSATTMAWYQLHRLDLLRSRLALAGGDRSRAGELALAIEADAAARGARRHALIAGAVAGLADGHPVDRLDPVVDGLADCAGLDGWRYVAELGTHFGVDRWIAEARRRAAVLVAAADGYDGLGDSARRFVDRLLD